MDQMKWRRDGKVGDDNTMQVLWGFRLPDTGQELREGLVMLYSLNAVNGKRPAIYALGMTHEFTVFEMSPETPIDFDRSMFEQKELQPLTPATVGYQFRASSSGDAMDRLDKIVQLIGRMELPPDISREWEQHFPDGVDLAPHMLDASEMAERAKIERTATGDVDAITRKHDGATRVVIHDESHQN